MGNTIVAVGCFFVAGLWTATDVDRRNLGWKVGWVLMVLLVGVLNLCAALGAFG